MRPRLHSTKGPRGIQTTTPAMRAAVSALRLGETRAAVANEHGIATSTLSKWVQLVRDAENDARNMGSGGD